MSYRIYSSPLQMLHTVPLMWSGMIVPFIIARVIRVYSIAFVIIVFIVHHCTCYTRFLFVWLVIIAFVVNHCTRSTRFRWFDYVWSYLSFPTAHVIRVSFIWVCTIVAIVHHCICYRHVCVFFRVGITVCIVPHCTYYTRSFTEVWVTVSIVHKRTRCARCLYITGYCRRYRSPVRLVCTCSLIRRCNIVCVVHQCKCYWRLA